MSKLKDTLISIICPIFNEAQISPSFFEILSKTLAQQYEQYEIILITDSSEKKTILFAQNLVTHTDATRMIQLSQKVDPDLFITAGLDSCIGDYIVVAVPNQDPVELIPLFINQCIASQTIILGTREKPQTDFILVRLLRSLFYFVANSILKLELSKNTTFFVAMNRKAVTEIMRIKDRFRFLKIITAQTGIPVTKYTYPYRNRAHHRSFFDSLNLSINVIISQTTLPLRLGTYFSLIFFALNFLFFVLFSFRLKLSGQINELLPLLLTASLSLIFLIFSLFTEYTIYIINESKNGPLYNVTEERHSTKIIANNDLLNVIDKADSKN